MSLLACGCATGDLRPQEPLCVLDPAAMPASWRPAGDVQKSLSSAPWSAEETEDAAFAVQRGLDELIAFFSDHPAAIGALQDNAVESLLDASYSADNMATLKAYALQEARAVLTPLLRSYLERPIERATCNQYSSLLSFTIYAHALLTPTDPRTGEMIRRTNIALHDCGSLERAMKTDYRRTLSNGHASTDALFDLAMWSISFTDAQTITGLELPPDARALAPALWQYIRRYSFPAAHDHPEGAANERFYDAAYLATHVAYIPTGYGRHPIYITDAPNLYRFLRENFYAVLQFGELDLTAEFVDLFRQYGCTEQNDLQLRDGTRYLMKLFHRAGDHWMAHREPGSTAQPSDYDLIHAAWTGMSGVRARVPEPPAAGTYGGVVRAWLGHPARQ